MARLPVTEHGAWQWNSKFPPAWGLGTSPHAASSTLSYCTLPLAFWCWIAALPCKTGIWGLMLQCPPSKGIVQHPAAALLSYVFAKDRHLPKLSCHCCHHCQIWEGGRNWGDLLSVNCIYVLGRWGKKGNLKLSDTENGTEREGRCLREDDSAIAAAWQSPEATQRKRKKEEKSSADGLCLLSNQLQHRAGYYPKGHMVW